MQRSIADVGQRLKVLSLYKNLYKNLKLDRQLNEAPKRGHDSRYIEQLRNEFRQYSVTDSKYCMPRDEMFFVASVFSTYLDSTQKTLELYSRYCRGERSIQEAANIVGLGLPKVFEGSSEK
jgi:hypothetical protein